MGLFQKKSWDDDDEETPSGVSEVLPPIQPRRSAPPAAARASTVPSQPSHAQGSLTGQFLPSNGQHAAPPAQAPAQASTQASAQASARETRASAPPAPTQPSMPPPVQEFGIEEAIRLLHALRSPESDAVRWAVQKTLELAKVDLARVLSSGAALNARIQDQIARLTIEADQHEALALAARKQIAALETHQTELGAVQAWLTSTQSAANGHERRSAAQHEDLVDETLSDPR
ncbi:MAG: hypothetical protein IT384_28635 [Deltaproteobacteria bacterium]|nr:hypothetical protein [Deltaproteobacteria bacterium]